MLHARVASAKEQMAVASNRTPSLGVDGIYTDELDTRRYTLSLSLPLAFGAKNDAERAAAMHTYEAARRELEAFKNRYAQQTRALKQRLDIYLSHVKKSEKTIALSADTLIEQSRMRFKAGEEGLIGMLKAAETKLQMIETILELKTNRLEAVYRYLDEYAVDPEGAL
jgi:outer membrane protein TolC